MKELHWITLNSLADAETGEANAWQRHPVSGIADPSCRDEAKVARHRMLQIEFE